MKKMIIAILLTLSVATAVEAQDIYEVVSLDGNAMVKVSGKNVAVGDKFASDAEIQWGDKQQTMNVSQVATGKVFRLSSRQFSTKGRDVKSLKTLFSYTSVEVARDEAGQRKVNLTVKESSKKEYYPEKRFAVVIANSTYSADPELAKGAAGYASLPDGQRKAQLFTDSLNTLGYDVIESYDANTGELQTITKYLPSVANGNDAVLVCYIGHSMVKDGETYLVPVNAMPSDGDLTEKCVKCADIIQALAKVSCTSRTLVVEGDNVSQATLSAEAAEALSGIKTAFSLEEDCLGSRSENIYAKKRAEEKAAEDEAQAAIDALAALDQASQTPATPEDYYKEGIRLIDKSSKDYNFDNGITYLKKAANSGHVEAMYELAVAYQGVNEMQAMLWMGRASAAGSEKAKEYIKARKTKPTGK